MMLFEQGILQDITDIEAIFYCDIIGLLKQFVLAIEEIKFDSINMRIRTVMN